MEDNEIEYDENLGVVTYEFDAKRYQIKIANVTNVVVNRDKKIILMTTKQGETEKLIGYSIFGELLFSRPAPERYRFWYLSPSDLRIACEGKDEFSEKSGRTGWWFKINIANGEMTKDCWAY